MHNLSEKRFCESLLERASRSFARFWNEERHCLYDVIDVEGTTARDDKIRPNQILAISLPYCALPPAQMRAVVERCGRDLLTSYGLRSLSAERTRILRILCRRSVATRCRLPHGHGVGVAARALRPRALSRVSAMPAWRSPCSSPSPNM